jgi:DNA-binding NtrC family response regulator
MNMTDILIVDNNEYRNGFLRKQLADEGYRVSIIDDIEMLPSNLNGSQFDLALLNLQLEGFSSWKILIDIKEIEPSFPVLVYSIKNHDSIIALKETIIIVLGEKKHNNLDEHFGVTGNEQPVTRNSIIEMREE